MDEERFLALYEQGLPDMDIAEALFGNRKKNSGQRVSRLRTSRGLPPHRAKRGPKTDTSLDSELVRLYQQERLTCAAIAERVGRKEPFVYDRLVRLGVHEGGHARGRYDVSATIPTDLEDVWIQSAQPKTLPSGGVLVLGSAIRVAAHYGVSAEVATNWLKSADLLKDRLPRASEWKHMYEGGMSCEAIAIEVGTGPITVSKYLKKQGVQVKNGYSYAQEVVAQFVESLGVRVERDNRIILGGKHLDIYCPDQKVAIEYNGTYWHSHPMLLSKGLSETEARNYHFDKTLGCQQAGVRLIHVWEHLWDQPHKRLIYENMITHALGLSPHRVGARQTRVEKRTAASMRSFFEENNIQGYRQARDAYVLVDKKTDLDLMCYTAGHAYFGKGIYDMEIARGACRLGYSVCGGATKLWKAIIADNPDVKSIVYYIDLNHYDGDSVMGLPGTRFVKNQPSFWNWHVAEEKMRNREPARHAEITAGYRDGTIIQVYNAGTAVYLWERDKGCEAPALPGPGEPDSDSGGVIVAAPRTPAS